MAIGGWEAWVNDAQLCLAGVAAMVAVYQVAVGRWRRQWVGPWALALTSTLAAGVLAANTVVVSSLGDSDLNAWMVVRDVLISGLLLSAVLLICALVGGRPSRLWM